jgi:ABC-type lipoprotein export system ATPase subunit
VVVTHSLELAELFPRRMLMEDGCLQSSESRPETRIRSGLS